MCIAKIIKIIFIIIYYYYYYSTSDVDVKRGI